MPASMEKTRSRRHWSAAMRRTRFSSLAPTGWKRSKWSSRRKRNSSGSSSRRICLLARRPWRRRLRLEAALPSAVRGPVDFLAFSRLALICASVNVRGSFDFFILVVAGAVGPLPLWWLGGGGGGCFGGFLCGVEKRRGEVFWGGGWLFPRKLEGPVLGGEEGGFF